MSDTTPVRVKLIGFTPSTRTLLKSSLAGFARKGRTFTEASEGARPSVYLLDGDDIVACEQWRLKHQNGIDAPVVAVGRAPFDLNVPTMSKPLSWGDLYDTLTKALLSPPPAWPVGNTATAHDTNPSSTIDSARDMSFTRNKKILVVDDSATVRHYMSIKLAQFGMIVDYAESGEEAVEKCKTSTYEIVFLDVVMPGLDGYDTCKIIRTMLPEVTPVVMVTTRDSPFDKMRGTLAGCSAYLVKPVDENAIFEIMRRLLKAATPKE